MSDPTVTPPADETPPSAGWMSDVQRALALILIGILASSAAALVARVMWSAPIDDVVDLAKTLLAAIVNMGLIALGFFFGNTIAKMRQDAGQQRLTDKLTSTAPGTLPPPPAGQTAAAWWPLLQPAEQTAINQAAATDPKVKAFADAAVAGRATADDLAYVVSKGLLTQTRADQIQG